VIRRGNFTPRHTDNSDELSDEESQASDKFHCTSATTDTKKVHLCNESYLSSCLFHCAPSVANNLQMQQGSSKIEMTLNYKSQPKVIILNGYWNLNTNKVKLLSVKSQSVKSSGSKLFSSRNYCPEKEVIQLVQT
jgi:hypothetical protein